MLLTEIRVRGFRTLRDVVLPLDDLTVILGPNNTGKSAVLDALRLALTRPGTQRHFVVSEYDFYAADGNADPRKATAIEIELHFSESQAKEWPQAVVDALHEIVQLDPERSLSSIAVRFRSAYDAPSKAYTAEWEFLDAKGNTLRAPRTALTTLTNYAPVFYLSALRDAADEFGSRSQFWGRLLRSVDLPEATLTEVQQKLGELNATLLKGDPGLERVTNALGGVASVLYPSGSQSVQIEPLPVKPWELMSRSQVTLQTQGNDARFPLNRHGQGVQSMAVLFLFNAFVDHLLELLFVKHSRPILALEEPEAHLHPQAARALFQEVKGLRGQKVVTTHCPYFLQNTPLRSIRVLRRSGPETKAYWIPAGFDAELPQNAALDVFVADNADHYSYHKGTGRLHVRRRISPGEYRSLLTCYTGPQRNETHAVIKDLLRRSLTYLSPEDLVDLEEYAKRIRGDVFFARTWILCEGQTEHLLLHYFSEALGRRLDACGVAVIDYQNNGNPGVFAALARTLAFPWFMLCDGDKGGSDHLKQLRRRGFEKAELDRRVRQLPKGNDLETFMIQNGGLPTMAAVANARRRLTKTPGAPGYEEEVAEILRSHKRTWVADTIELWRKNGAPATPEMLKTLIETATGDGAS